MSTCRRRYRIIGRVQGVGFRWWTRETARALGVRGWVKNRADGSVEVEATGPSERVAELAEALARGPASARVDRVEEERVERSGGESGPGSDDSGYEAPSWPPGGGKRPGAGFEIRS